MTSSSAKTSTVLPISAKGPLAMTIAEVEAEVEQFRRQAYLRRGLSYPGPATVSRRPETIVSVRKKTAGME
jgi:hypothetical protein